MFFSLLRQACLGDLLGEHQTQKENFPQLSLLPENKPFSLLDPQHLKSPPSCEDVVLGPASQALLLRDVDLCLERSPRCPNGKVREHYPDLGVPSLKVNIWSRQWEARFPSPSVLEFWHCVDKWFPSPSVRVTMSPGVSHPCLNWTPERAAANVRKAWCDTISLGLVRKSWGLRDESQPDWKTPPAAKMSF